MIERLSRTRRNLVLLVLGALAVEMTTATARAWPSPAPRKVADSDHGTRLYPISGTIAPRGTAVLVGAIAHGQHVSVNAGHFFLEKRIIGCMMGSNRFTVDAPHYLDLYRQGRLDLDSMVTRTAPLEGLNEAFRAMEAGEVTRTVLTFN